MTNNESIKKFVRYTLGCKCPDNVFEQIADQIQQGIPAILAAGRKARDELGLNRFRAILVTDNPSTINSQADLCLSQFRDLDEKMHLHVVSSKGFAGI